MNNQQAFDIALRGMRAQKYRRSMTSYGMCCYASHNGDRCAIGHLLPESVLGMVKNSLVNTSTLSDLKNFYAVTERLFDDCGHNFLLALQGVHDNINNYFPSLRDTQKAIEMEMKRLAEEWGLEYRDE